MAFFGGWAGVALQVGGTLSDISVMGSEGSTYGISTDCGQLVVLTKDLVATDVGTGITSTGGFNILPSIDSVVIANACTIGINPYPFGGQIGGVNASVPNNRVYLNHCVNGISTLGGQMQLGFVVASTNDVAVHALEMGSLRFGGFGSFMDSNGTDLVAEGMSYIRYQRVGLGVGGPAPTCSPAANTVGNRNSYIYVFDG
jgi:hypothetical protein